MIAPVYMETLISAPLEAVWVVDFRFPLALSGSARLSEWSTRPPASTASMSPW